MDQIYIDSLTLHKTKKGKIGTALKVDLASRRDLSLAYTPGVAEVCRAIAGDENIAHELTLKANTVAIVSDGSAILGLGNLGAKAAIPVMEGKAALLKEFAGVDAFPICLDTQDNEEIIRTVKLIAPVFGAVNLEDICAPRCFEVEERLMAELDIPVMHDDQHGTATVVLAGLINALKIRGSQKEEVKVLVNGVGAAGTAITKILADYGFKNITLCDSRGVISRAREDLNGEKIKLLDYLEEKGCLPSEALAKEGLTEAISGKDIFIGVSKGNLLTEEMVKSMAERPIIFGLANPVPEIMPDVAKSAGAFVVATGRSDFPNQVNNVLAFPGLFRGALDNRIKKFTPEMFVQAALNLAACVENPTVDQILPDPFDKKVAEAVASAIK